MSILSPKSDRASLLVKGPRLSLTHGFRGSMLSVQSESRSVTGISKLYLVRNYVSDFLDTKVAAAISAVATIVSLLAFDFTVAFLPKEVDESTDIILFLCFIWFTIEIFASMACKKSYIRSFWFFLDVVATISLIPDISLLLVLVGVDPSQMNLSQARAGRAGKSARSSVALKAVRMIRFSRLLRVVRVFRFFSTATQEGDDEKALDPVDSGSTRIGQDLTESVTKKVIALVLLLVVVLPWLDPSEGSYSAAVGATLDLFDFAVQYGAAPSAALSLLTNGVENPLLYAKHNNTVYFEDSALLTARRDSEKWNLQTGNSLVIFDNRQYIFEEAGLGLLLTLFALGIFAMATTCINASAMSLVVEPISKMVHVMLHMAGVIGLLGGASSVEKVLEENNEMHLVEVLCNRVSDIFGGSGSKSAVGRPNKAMSMMAMKKVTTINTGDRVIEIDVSEKRGNQIEQEVRDHFTTFSSNFAHDDMDLDDVKEFDSLEKLIENPMTHYCLRMFMTSNLTVNNLIFYHRAVMFKEQMRSDFASIHRQFIDDSSPAQINLDAKDFKKLDDTLASETVLDEHTLEKAVAETWKLMEDNIFKQFKQSIYAKFYVWMKENHASTINQLQMTDINLEA